MKMIKKMNEDNFSVLLTLLQTEELICIDDHPNLHSFEVIIKTEYALYFFEITIGSHTSIKCSVNVTGQTKIQDYEYDSQEDAWAHFNSKIKKFLH
jgi:hypothetical protein